MESIKASLSTEESLKEFLMKRLAGARKIQASAQKKGGYSLLTAIHFKAKFRPYSACMKHTDSSKFAEEQADRCLSRLKNWKKMSQREFQTVMGELEAYGEVYIREEKPMSIKLS
jgi:gas vesicle protein